MAAHGVRPRMFLVGVSVPTSATHIRIPCIFQHTAQGAEFAADRLRLRSGGLMGTALADVTLTDDPAVAYDGVPLLLTSAAAAEAAAAAAAAAGANSNTTGANSSAIGSGSSASGVSSSGSLLQLALQAAADSGAGAGAAGAWAAAAAELLAAPPPAWLVAAGAPGSHGQLALRLGLSLDVFTPLCFFVRLCICRLWPLT